MPQYVTGSLHIKKQLYSKGDVLNIRLVQKSGQTQPQEGQEIILKDGSRYLFGGFVTKIDAQEVGVGQQFQMNVEGTDYTYILSNKVAVRTYTNQTLHYIVNDLISSFIDSGYSITITGVENPGPVIDSVFFNYISVRKCLEKITSLTGYNWWIDYQRNIYFVAPTAISAPESFKDSAPGNHSSMSIVFDTTQVRNSIVAKGGQSPASSNATNAYKGDGNARQWFLQGEPTATPTVTVNGVSKTVGVDPTDDETGFNYMYNSDQKYVRASSGTTTLTTSDVISISYPYNYPILIIMEDAVSIAFMKALEGGDGKHQYTVTDNTVKSKDEARAKAATQLQLYSQPLVTGTVKTRTGQLLAGSYFYPGQYVTINSPSWGINSDTSYLIQEVDVTTQEDGTNIEYLYTIIFGGRLQGLQVFLESLADEETLDSTDQSIDTIRAVNEAVTITESISKNAHLQTANETVTVGESISKTNVTPPFKWGPTADPKKGRWVESEWG